MIQLTFECNIPVWGYKNPPQKHRKKWTKNYNADEENKKKKKCNTKCETQELLNKTQYLFKRFIRTQILKNETPAFKLICYIEHSKQEPRKN